jgi:hypothetical protein
MRASGRGAAHAALRARRALVLEPLEPRLLLSTINEVEPNSPASPQNINAAFSVSGTSTTAVVQGAVNAAGDLDAFRFTAQAGQLLLISANAVDYDITCYLDLYDNAGHVLRTGATPGNTYDARVAFVVPATGAYTVVLSDAYGSATGAYSLAFVRADPTDLDAQMAPLGGGGRGATVAGRIEAGGEVDYYTLTLAAGRALTVDVTTPAGNLDSTVEVLNPAGWSIAMNDDRRAGDPDPYVRTVAVGAGLYAIIVSGYDAGEAGEYQMLVNDLPPTALVYDAQGRAVGGGALSLTTNAFVYGLGTLSAGTPLHLNVTIKGAAPDTFLGLYDSTGRSLIVADDLGRNVNPDVRTVIQRTDDYFVVVAAAYEDAGPFTLHVDQDPVGPLPQKPTQVVYLDTDGRATLFAGVIHPFTAASVGFYGPGDTQTIVSGLLARLEEVYAPYNIVFTTTQPSTGIYSVIALGSDNNETMLGLAQNIDATNVNLSETCVVYGGAFTLFQPCTVQEMGLVLGNVAAHELGHLLGLSHVADPNQIMDDTGNADAMLAAQGFGNANVSYAPVIEENAAIILAHTLGPGQYAFAGHPFIYTDADGDVVQVVVQGPGQFMLVNRDGVAPNGEDAVAGWFNGAFTGATTVTFTDLNPGGADTIVLDFLSASAAVGGVVGANLEVGAAYFTALDPTGVGLVVRSIGDLTLTAALAGAVDVEALGAVHVRAIAATGRLTVAGGLADLSIPGVLAGRVEIGGDVTSVAIGGRLPLGAALTIGGTLQSGAIARDFAGTLTLGSLAGEFTLRGAAAGDIHLTGGILAGGQLNLLKTLTGAILVDGDSPGSLWLRGGIGRTRQGAVGRVTFAADAGDIHVLGKHLGILEVGDDLERLELRKSVSAAGAVTVGGALADATLTGLMAGAFSAGRITGAVTFAGSTVGAITVTGDGSGTLTINRDLVGVLDLQGDWSGGTVNVRRDLKGRLTADTLGVTEVFRDLTGTLTAARLAERLNVDRDLKGSIILTDPAPNTQTIYVGRDLRGALSLAGPSTGPVNVGRDVTVGARLTFGGALDSLSVSRHLAAAFTVSGGLGALTVDGSLRRSAAVTVLGDLDFAAVGARLDGALTAQRLTYSLAVGTTFAGALTLTGPDDCAAIITVGWDLSGAIALAGGFSGALSVDHDVTRRAAVEIGGDANLVYVERHFAGRLGVDGDLWGLAVGGSVQPSAAVTVAGNAGMIDILGAQGGTVDIGGQLTDLFAVGVSLAKGRSTTIAGGLAAGSTFSVALDVLQPVTLGPLAGLFTVGRDLRAPLAVSGDLTGALDVARHAVGPITLAGDVYGAVSVGGNLAFFDSASTPVPEDPDVSDVDYLFQVAGIDQGTLTVGGAIGVVQ